MPTPREATTSVRNVTPESELELFLLPVNRELDRKPDMVYVHHQFALFSKCANDLRSLFDFTTLSL